MSRQVGSVIVSRLIILILIVLVPVAVFLIFLFVDFDLWWSQDAIVDFWIIKVLCPSVFAISWLFFLILFADRTSKTIDSMDKVISIIPLRLKMFYGMIALVILFIFIFPIITPLVAIISFASMAWRATTSRKQDWGDLKTPWYTKILMVLAAIIPLFCTVSIAPEYLSLSFFVSSQIWTPLTDFIFTISYCLCTALAIGSLFVLVANKGVSEYEIIFVNVNESRSMWYVKIFEFILFIFFLFLAYGNFAVIDLFYTGGFVIVIFVSIVNYFSGKQRTGKYRAHILGYLLAAVFMGSNLLIFNVELSQIWTSVSLIVLAGVFIIVFFITFIYLEEIE